MVVLLAFALAGCGSKASVDAGGFTSSERTAAQTALDSLAGTAIPRRVLAISYQAGVAPACTVVPAAKGSFTLVLVWTPSGPDYRTTPSTVIQATVGPTKLRRFSVTTFGGGAKVEEPPAVQAAVERAQLAKPAEQCQALTDGHLQLLTT